MLSQVFWLSLVLAGTGMVAGLILGFLLYPGCSAVRTGLIAGAAPPLRAIRTRWTR